MHWVYFNHYGKYEDLSYYDRLAARKREKQTNINTMIPENKEEDLPMSKKEEIDPVDKSNKKRKGKGTDNKANQRKTDDRKDLGKGGSVSEKDSYRMRPRRFPFKGSGKASFGGKRF